MIKKVIAGVALVAVLALGFIAYTVFREPEAASGPLTAIPLAAAPSAVAPTAAASPAAATSAPAAATSAPAAETSAPTTAAPASVIAQIVAAESEARFVINEVLNGAPKEVVGTTKDVAGEIAINAQDPTQIQLGTIQVNARTLTTDSEFRNRAIKNAILQTNDYEFVTFKPSAITGLPAQGTVGTPYTFQIAGDLTIRDQTKPVTFEVTAQAESDKRFTGTAKTTVRYADFGITIPQVRQVTQVDETVRIEIDLVAVVP